MAQSIAEVRFITYNNEDWDDKLGFEKSGNVFEVDDGLLLHIKTDIESVEVVMELSSEDGELVLIDSPDSTPPMWILAFNVKDEGMRVLPIGTYVYDFLRVRGQGVFVKRIFFGKITHKPGVTNASS